MAAALTAAAAAAAAAAAVVAVSEYKSFCDDNIVIVDVFVGVRTRFGYGVSTATAVWCHGDDVGDGELTAFTHAACDKSVATVADERTFLTVRHDCAADECLLFSGDGYYRKRSREIVSPFFVQCTCHALDTPTVGVLTRAGFRLGRADTDDDDVDGRAAVCECVRVVCVYVNVCVRVVRVRNRSGEADRGALLPSYSRPSESEVPRRRGSRSRSRPADTRGVTHAQESGAGAARTYAHTHCSRTRVHVVGGGAERRWDRPAYVAYVCVRACVRAYVGSRARAQPRKCVRVRVCAGAVLQLRWPRAGR